MSSIKKAPSKTIPLLVVTKSSSDGNIRKGEHVWYSSNSSLCITGKNGGWYEKNELTKEMTDFEYVEHPSLFVLVSNRCEQVVKKTDFLSNSAT